MTQSQGGLAQGSYGGSGWLKLGAYSISSGTLEVLLSNKASGTSVDAEGVLIVPVVSEFSLSIGDPGVVGQASSGLTGTTTVAEPTQTKTAATTSAAAPTTVAIAGVSEPAAVSVIYNQGAPASSPSAPVRLIDAALSQVDTSGTTQTAEPPNGHAASRSRSNYPA